MAQSRLEPARLAGVNPMRDLAGDSHEVQQYEKIIRFKDAVLSGKHPGIKLPPSLTASAQPSIPSTHPPIPTGPKSLQKKQPQPFPTSVQQPAVSPASYPGAAASANAKPYGLGSTEINPILLEKSDDLIKAELQLQRQRLERALRDEVELRRAAVKSSGQAEPLADFDLSDVLSKALTLVQATAAAPVDETISAANNDAASDSFDDNTFYSSQHNTPESLLASRVPNESPPGQPAEIPRPQPLPSLNQHQIQSSSLQVDHRQGNPASRPQPAYPNRPDISTASAGYVASGVTQVPGLTEPSNVGVASSGPSQNTSGAPSQSEDSANMDIDQQLLPYGRHSRQQQNDPYVDSRPPSPLIRGHDLSPYAPQPAHVSQLAVSGRLPPAEHLPHSSTGTPAQVAALRNEPAAATSPESSPQGGKLSDKRKGKKKKRKADRQVPETDAVPYIKPEPRSASPMAAPSYMRPSKRQRYTQRQPNEPIYDAPSYDHPNVHGQAQSYPTIPPRDGQLSVAYERADAQPPRLVNAAVVGGPSYGRDYVDDRRIAGDPYTHGQPPLGYTVEYGCGVQPGNPANPIRADDPYREPPRSYRETYEVPRMSARPEGDAFMRPPPRQQPTRIVVDAYGREYIEPPRPALVRHSAAPPVHHGEPEIIYERAAPQALSRHPGMDSYEEGGVIYGRPSPSYSMQRRVVAQPEYAAPEYRSTQHREYPARPLAPAGDYVEVMAPAQRRHGEDASRDFVARSASVRPTEAIRYEVPHDYGRVQSVRPEAAVRAYAASAHPESHREAGQPYPRDYGPRPVEQPIVRQEYSMRPVERYYDQGARAGEEIAFIERPRGTTQEIVYASDARREVYR